MEILTHLGQIFADKNIQPIRVKGCIHVGAHEGQEYNVYKAYGMNSMIFYEPLKENFEKLKSRLRYDPFVDLRMVALGNQTGEVEMHLEERGLSSSVLEPAHHLEQYPQIKFDKKETVKIVRLDDEEFPREEYNFLNIDVQGYELEVLRGAEETLKHIDIIISEVNRAEMYKGCARIEDIDEFLLPRGFNKVFEYWQLDGGTWGDALYVRKQ